MKRCRWVTHNGERFILPECMGTATHLDCDRPLDFCYCTTELTVRQQIKALEAEIEILRGQLRNRGE